MEETVLVKKSTLEEIASLANKISHPVIIYNADKTIMMERVISDCRDIAEDIDKMIGRLID
jgi:predicted molibdopterin-dependent oxidoreductase YjgC